VWLMASRSLRQHELVNSEPDRWRCKAQRFERLELQRTGAPPIAFFVSTPSG
jgi:hypothetical protein